MILNNGRVVSKKNRPYIVAELNSSHFGRIELAEEMINSAKACGCDGVKFQSWTSESLYCRDYYESDPIAERIVKKFSLSSQDIKRLSLYCREKKIGFSSTPYSEEEVDQLADLFQADYIKIASMDINNLPFLDYIGKKNVPVVLSTGMADKQEIDEAIKCLENAGNTNICILHCVSVYPSEAKEVNLNNLLMLRQEFPDYEVGYSDHTMGYETACAAVALGASFIEKHFTLNNSKVGWDNQMATEPSEMKELVEKCHSVYNSLGNFDRILSDKEIDQRRNMRRSVVSKRDLYAGDVITKDDITAKRPGTGIPVGDYEEILGKRVKRDIKRDHLIKREDLEVGEKR